MMLLHERVPPPRSILWGVVCYWDSFWISFINTNYFELINGVEFCLLIQESVEWFSSFGPDDCFDSIRASWSYQQLQIPAGSSCGAIWNSASRLWDGLSSKSGHVSPDAVARLNVLSLVKYDSKMAIVLLLMDVVIVSVSGKRSYLLAHL